MKEAEAEEFLRLVKEGQRSLEAAANYLLTLEYTEQHKNLRSKLTEIIAITITDLEMPLIAQYPEFNAYK
jgi:hypothetical protein